MKYKKITPKQKMDLVIKSWDTRTDNTTLASENGVSRADIYRWQMRVKNSADKIFERKQPPRKGSATRRAIIARFEDDELERGYSND